MECLAVTIRQLQYYIKDTGWFLKYIFHKTNYDSMAFRQLQHKCRDKLDRASDHLIDYLLQNKRSSHLLFCLSDCVERMNVNKKICRQTHFQLYPPLSVLLQSLLYLHAEFKMVSSSQLGCYCCIYFSFAFVFEYSMDFTKYHAPAFIVTPFIKIP